MTSDASEQQRDGEALVRAELHAGQADEQERRRREGAHRKPDRHLAQQRRLRHRTGATPSIFAVFGDDRQHAEVERVGIEQQAERHRDDAERERQVRRQRGGMACTAAAAIAVDHPRPLHDSGERAGREQDARPSSARRARARRSAPAASSELRVVDRAARAPCRA